MQNIKINYYEGFRDDFTDYLPLNPKKILEIGAGNGGFKNNFCEDVEYWIVEPNIDAAIDAAKIVNYILRGTYVEVEAEIPDEYFDLIICNDVIEHMADWWSFLRRIQKKLHREGCLVGSIPNVRYFDALFKVLVKKDWPYEHNGRGGIFDATHFAFFTLKSFTRELINANLNVVKIDLERGFRYTKAQNRVKYILTTIFIWLLGNDSAYSHIYFSCSKRVH